MRALYCGGPGLLSLTLVLGIATAVQAEETRCRVVGGALEFGGGGGITWDKETIEAGGEIDWTIPSSPIPLYPPLFLNLGAGFAIKGSVSGINDPGKSPRECLGGSAGGPIVLKGTGLPTGEDGTKTNRDPTMQLHVELTFEIEGEDGKTTEITAEADKQVRCRVSKGRKPDTEDIECTASISLTERPGGKVGIVLK